MDSMHDKWAIVTGASSGIGKDFAAALAEKGANLILVARRVEPMEQLGVELRAKHNIQVRVEGVDLSVSGAAAKLKEKLDADGIFVTALINNAGFGLINEFVNQSTDRITSMLQLNVIGLTEMTHVFARPMKERGGGYILLVASVAAYQPCPIFAAYAATKAYVLSLGEALHTELAPHQVVVTVLAPGVTQSEFFTAAGQKPSPAMLRMMMKSRPVVDIGLQALFKGRSSVVAGKFNRLLTLGSGLIPRQMAARIGMKMAKL